MDSRIPTPPTGGSAVEWAKSESRIPQAPQKTPEPVDDLEQPHDAETQVHEGRGKKTRLCVPLRRKRSRRKTADDAPDWRVTIRPTCKELSFVFPKEQETMPREILIKTECATTRHSMSDALGTAEGGKMTPVRSDSPELLRQSGAAPDTQWLSERASIALNELLASLKIDPEMLSSAALAPRQERQPSALLRSPNEGKLALKSYPLSTCSV